MEDWNAIAHRRIAEGRCPNCDQPCRQWFGDPDHDDGDGGFVCPQSGR